MSKKKRKTRAEKSLSIKHQFPHPVFQADNRISQPEQVENKGKTSNILPTNIKDIKTVAVLVIVTVVILLTLAILIYKTDVFGPIFSRLNINY